MATGTGSHDKITSYIAARPAAATLLAIAPAVVVAEIVRRVATPDPEALGPLSWVALVVMLETPVSLAVLPRFLKGPGSATVLLQWGLAQTPLLLAVVAQFDSGPRWVLYAALVESIVLVYVIIRRAPDAAQAKPFEPGNV